MTAPVADIRRHRGLIAGVASTVMLASIALSVPALLSLQLSISDLTLWPAVTAFIVSGWVLAVRRPDNPVGWLLLMTAVGFSFLPWSVLSSWLLVHHVAAAKWTAGLSGASFVLDVGGLALLLPLLFPDGRLPSAHRWWRVVLWADIFYMVFASFNLFEPGALNLPGYPHRLPNPFGLPHATRALGILIGACAPALMIGFAGSFSAVVVRWRRAGTVQRAQMKWVIPGLLMAPVPFVLHDWALGVSNALMPLVIPVVPICMAVAVLRYRLYDIDRIVSRAVSYLLVSGLLVGVYVGSVALLTSVLAFGSSVGVAASTLAAAALFQPLRRRVQRGVDRRFNRERYDVVRTVDAFSSRLRDAIDPVVVQGDLLTVVAGAMQPASVSLWVTQ